MKLENNPWLQLERLGEMPYGEALLYQERCMQALVAVKLASRRGSPLRCLPHKLLFCTHPPVITGGRRARAKDLLSNKAQLHALGISYHETNRGGELTYHGPGQLVAYPILDLEVVCRDIHRYVRTLEAIVIDLLADYGLAAERLSGLTGVWLPMSSGDSPCKVAAIGVRCSHWVSMHGVALNVSPMLSHFEHIVPCGIADKGVCSMQQFLGQQTPSLRAVEERFLHHFLAHFKLQLMAS